MTFSSLSPYSVQVFPGELHFGALEFKAEMKDRSSALFRETAANITNAVGCELFKHVEIHIFSLSPVLLFIHLNLSLNFLQNRPNQSPHGKLHHLIDKRLFACDRLRCKYGKLIMVANPAS